MPVRIQETQRLNDIATQWTQVQMAILGQGPAAREAKGALFQRYGGAIRRYLQAALGQPAAVDDVTQEFAVALVSGGFRHVQPERGRFRDYVKGVLFRLVRKHRRQGQRQAAGQLATDVDLADPESFRAECDEHFRQDWRDELLARTWEELALEDPTYFTVLHHRAVHPHLRSEQMIDELSTQLGKRLTAPGIRQILRRARKRFATMLMQRVAGSLEFPTPSAIHEELQDLELAAYVPAPRKAAR
jgi:RNA polymerase sigma-70 factor (ECF subfamily)